MKLELSVWTPHLNHLLYSYYFYCKEEKIKCNILFNQSIRHNCGLLTYIDQTILFDYSDDHEFLVNPINFDFYFKRSLSLNCSYKNVYPLNFNVSLTYKALNFLFEVDRSLLRFKHNRTELFRALDYFHLKSNAAHSLMDIRRFPEKISKGNGQCVFYTRLWNPNTTSDPLEKERRILQNDFRINACRVINKNFKKSIAGLFPDVYSIENASDVVLDMKSYKKSNYLKKVKEFSIGIADDGLKDTPGWKIGEYLLYGKAVISTPISIQTNNFEKNMNFLELSNRSAYKELPDAISDLQKNDRFLEMGQTNLNWSDTYLHPKNYINRILEIVSSQVTQ